MRENEQDSGSSSTSPATSVNVRPIEVDDLGFVVTQHLAHFSDGFFARLGERFLHEYYRSFISCTGASALVAVRGTEPVGFLTGTLDPAEHRRQMLNRDGKKLALHGLRALVWRPALAIHFLRTRAMRYLRRLLGKTPPPPPPASAGRIGVLQHVAVKPEVQAQGIGSKLIARFEAESAEAGLSSLTLVTVAGPDGAGDYYEKNGWTRMGKQSTAEGRDLITYTKDVAGHDGGTEQMEPST